VSVEKSAEAFRTIGEAADELSLPQHVLRFWETKFSQIRPMKRSGGRRYYRPEDVELLAAIRHLLYDEGYTIKGVQRILKQQGVRAVIDLVAQLQRGETPAVAAALTGLDEDQEPVRPGEAARRAPGGADIGKREGVADMRGERTGALSADVASGSSMTGRLAPQVRQELETVLKELEACGHALASARSR